MAGKLRKTAPTESVGLLRQRAYCRELAEMGRKKAASCSAISGLELRRLGIGPVPPDNRATDEEHSEECIAATCPSPIAQSLRLMVVVNDMVTRSLTRREASYGWAVDDQTHTTIAPSENPMLSGRRSLHAVRFWEKDYRCDVLTPCGSDEPAWLAIRQPRRIIDSDKVYAHVTACNTKLTLKNDAPVLVVHDTFEGSVRNCAEASKM